VECGSVHLARVTVRKEVTIGDDEKMEYLKQVDFTSKRLWFLYELERKGGCGCAGNAEFFSALTEQGTAAVCFKASVQWMNRRSEYKIYGFGQSILVDEELALFSHKVSISTF